MENDFSETTRGKKTFSAITKYRYIHKEAETKQAEVLFIARKVPDLTLRSLIDFSSRYRNLNLSKSREDLLVTEYPQGSKKCRLITDF